MRFFAHPLLVYTPPPNCICWELIQGEYFFVRRTSCPVHGGLIAEGDPAELTPSDRDLLLIAALPNG